MNNHLAILGILALVGVQFPQLADAAQVGSWRATCRAPNWQTGRLEVVPDENVYGQGQQPLMAFTSRQPSGRWLIQFNYDRIMQWQLHPDVMIFLFYHECAHAQYNSEDEGVADCRGLDAMRKAGRIRSGTVQRIRSVYELVGRSFPSGRC